MQIQLDPNFETKTGEQKSIHKPQVQKSDRPCIAQILVSEMQF